MPIRTPGLRYLWIECELLHCWAVGFSMGIIPISHTTFNVHDLCWYPPIHHHSHYTPPSLLFWFFNKLLNNRYLLWYVWKIVIDMQINPITMNKYLYLLNASRLDGFRGNLYWFLLFFRSYLLELPVTIRRYHNYILTKFSVALQ